ncbi:unnamed protein product, partial [Phyllotreta striolata]
SASCLTLNVQENAKAIIEEQKRDAQFQEIIVSCKSLNRYDGKTIKTLLPQVSATLMAVSLHVAVGISMSFSGILVPAIDITLHNVTQNDTELYATKDQTAWLASIVVIAVPLGALSAGIIADTWGRLWPTRISVVPTVVGWCLIATAGTVPQLMIGRFLTGFATPWNSIPATVYVSEIARADMRGSLVVLAPTLASAGMLLTFLQGWFLHWRTVAWISNVFVLFPLLLLFLIPESPPWLVSKGRIEEAANSLRWLHRHQPQPENRQESYAELVLNKLQAEHQKKLELQARKSDLGAWALCKEFFKPTGYKPTLILTGLYFFQMFSGIYITLFYSVTFFQKVGSQMNPYLASIVICFVRMLMSFANSYLLKAFNRRFLLIASGIGMSVFMTISGFVTRGIKEGDENHSYLPVVCIILYVIASMVGMLCIPWTMMSELYPMEIRGVANCLAYSIGNVMMFASIQSFYGLLASFGGVAGVQWFFAVVAALACVYTYVFLPETHRKTLDEIAEYFVDNSVYILAKRKGGKRSKGAVGNGQREKLMGGR